VSRNLGPRPAPSSNRGSPKLDDFRHFVLAPRALIGALVITRFVGKNADEEHSRAASRAARRSEYCRRGGCHRSHRYPPRKNWREHNRSLRHRRPMFVVLFSADDDECYSPNITMASRMCDILGQLKWAARRHQLSRKAYYGNKDHCFCVATRGSVRVISHVARGRHRRV
jgi:hypothetical protein